jgi:transcriptional regulator with XRE-family HTH domain
MKSNRKYREEYDAYMSNTEYNFVVNGGDPESEKTINEIIFNLRKVYGYTQEEVAEKLNIKQNTLSRYERGERQIPFSMIKKILNFYNLDLDIVPVDEDDKETIKKFAHAVFYQGDI